jgi:hypothetical protein
MTLFFLIFLISLSTYDGISSCSLRLNEINVDGPEKEESAEFIELKKVNCETNTPSMEYYYIIIVKEYDSNFNKPIIVFSADLTKTIFPQSSEFFVIGAPSINPDLSFSSNHVTFRKKFRTPLQIALQLQIDYEKRQLTDAIENGNQVPLAVMLLKENDAKQLGAKQLMMPFPEATRRSKVFAKPIVITDEYGTIIKNSIVDMYIFSRRSFINSCNFFKEISFAISSSKHYQIGTEYDVVGHKDVSVNRCPREGEAESEIFMYTHFKLGTKTPHRINDCTGVHFIINENVQAILERGEPCCSNSDGPQKAIPSKCSAIAKVFDLHNVDSEAIVDERDCLLDIATLESASSSKIDTERQCSCINKKSNLSIVHEIEDIESGITFMANSVRKSGEPICKKQRLTNLGEHSRSTMMNEAPALSLKPWEDHGHFKNQWLQQIQKYQSRFVASTLFNNENKVWLEYLFAENDPRKSAFRCRFCKSFLDKHPTTKNVPLLAKASGYFIEDYKRMWKQISLHSSSLVHKKSILEIQEEYAKSLKDCTQEMKQQILSKISEEHLPSVKMIRTVYTEIKLNLPFSSHAIIVQLQKLNGVDLGKHHYEKTSATRITESISKKMHESLITHLNLKQYPMSLILDTSSDSGNKNYLLVYIRTIEENYPTTYFYRCLYVPTETSEYLFQKLIYAFRQDNLLQTIKNQMYGFASDGAPVMLGKVGGLAKRVQDITNNDFYKIHCFAHKLQLAMGHALISVDNNLKSKLENFVNGIYSFYYDKSFKRKQSLVETAETFGETFNELHYVHPIRWVTSEFVAFESLYKLYPIIVQNMQLIIESDDFTEEVSARASGYKAILLQTNFFTTFVFVMDVLKILGDVSLKFQKSDSTLIGKETMRLQMLKALENLKQNNGPFLTFFLQHALCNKNNIWTTCSANDLNLCDVKFVMKGKELQFNNRVGRRDAVGWSALSNLRLTIINSILAEINKYFPEGSVEMFDVFNPSKLPTLLKNVPKYSTGITNVASRFGFAATLLQKQFSNILVSMITHHHEMYCSLSKGDPITFWNYFLKSNTLIWEPEIKKLIYIVLTLPIGSADVERGFSIKNHFTTNWRSKLTTSHIEDIMRIRINGPEIQDFDPIIYTLHWLNTNHLDSDDIKEARHSIEKEHKKKSTLF